MLSVNEKEGKNTLNDYISFIADVSQCALLAHSLGL